MKPIKILRNTLVDLIENNLSKFDGRSISKFYKIAHTAQTEKLQKTIESINEIINKPNVKTNQIKFKNVADKVIKRVPKIKESKIIKMSI